MVQIEIVSEREQPAPTGGWAFETRILDDAGHLHQVRLTLSWADYNHWSADGADAPERVAEAVLAFLVSKQPPSKIRPALDASLVRRLFDDADEQIPRHIRRPF